MKLFKRTIKYLKRKRAFRLINGPLAGTNKFERKRKLLIKNNEVGN